MGSTVSITIEVVGQGKFEIEDGSSGWTVAKQLNLTGPDQAIAMRVNGDLKDLSDPLREGDTIQIFNFSDPEGQEIFWHTSAHILAQAVLRLWPDAKPTIGPPIENGFYYDFANLTISDEDFGKIEKEVKKIVKENPKSEREELTRDQALSAFSSNPYKVEIINEIKETEGLSAYRQGEFYDLCRGPHLSSIGKVKAFKVLKTSGAYWRGDAKNEMLTRIYGISYPNRDQLQGYLKQLEEAKKRDHKILGPRLDLFSLHEEGPGMPFFHPNGMHVWHQLMDFWFDCHRKADYAEIKTPVMLSQQLWERSGHWANYRENMFTSSIEERDFAIKPMNCPGCMLYYRSSLHSYREFPLRIGEIGLVHRYEPSGAISGLFRVRCFHQDDAHIFMRPDQIEEEILNVLELTDQIYTTFGLDYHLELSTRPEKDTIGTDEDWERATQGLEGALKQWGKEYKINEGDGAFYGPKIDLHIKDALGRTWQCGTIQLDMSLPERFDLEYIDQDGVRKRPVMIHRALYGSIERFFGILIEHFAGKFPLWLSPRQIRILTVADRHVTYAKQLQEQLTNSGFRCEVDDSPESVGKKVRTAQLDQVNYMLTIGDQEVENQTIALRTRDNVVHGEMSTDSFINALLEEKATKALVSPFSNKTE